jgi:2-polyprenyl-3-methyl-5-hydroxy-6-metoxy-1,4-benzoquinol methylase
VAEVRVAELARCWATDRAVTESGGQPVAPARLDEMSRDWEERIQKAIGSPTVAFYRCDGCRVEVSSPCRCWPDGAYPEDEHYPARWEFGRFLADLGPKPLRVLELGAGRGTFLGLAADRGHDVVGLDFNPAAVVVARSKGLEVIHGGFGQLREHLAGRPDEKFDAVAMFHVIEHLPDPAKVLAGLAEFVRPGAKLGVSCPGPRRFTRRIDVQQVGGRDYWDYPPHHVLRWTPEGLRAGLGRVGWEVEEVDEEPFWLTAAASQVGVTRALWRGYHHNKLRRRLGIAAAKLGLLPAAAAGSLRGLSLYARARYRAA